MKIKFDYKNNITCRNLIYHYTKLLNTDTAFQLLSSKIIPYAALITISFPSFPSHGVLYNGTEQNAWTWNGLRHWELLRERKQHILPQSASIGSSAPHLLLLLFISQAYMFRLSFLQKHLNKLQNIKDTVEST